MHRTEGSQNYVADTSLATSGLRVDADFPESAERHLGVPGTTDRRTLATVADDVYAQRASSAWLRFSPVTAGELGPAASSFTAYAAGDAAPFSGTLADLVPRTIPRQEPRRQPDGSRVYRVTALPEVAAELLPGNLRAVARKWGPDPVWLTVTLDAKGRLAKATADLGPVLARLHDRKVLSGVTRLDASYELTAFGEPVRYRVPGEDGARVEAAEAVLAPVGTLKGGQCAAADTGLDTIGAVRPVGCSEPHDLRVFAQTSVDLTFPGKKEADSGKDYGDEQCGRAYAEAPGEWLRGSGAEGPYSFTGSTSVVVSTGAGKTETTVSGAYTCYTVTS
ncbi:hypothetical protein [Streptomyces sp. PR69]|uniref:hypothetical protein n=1 Tax=Streptomyces sp. PR69 TaxID=2984950 RepID=UPI00226533D2|nr:hypothetical protein [Streptomyces sp. PR69]